jgi:CRP-like cAMP-binding protein
MFKLVQGPSLARLTEIAEVRRFDRGATIFRQDDPCPGAYIVGSGLVRIFKLAPNGKEHVLHLAGPRATFAEVAALLNTPCPAFAEAVEDTHCVLLPMRRFLELLEKDHPLCLQLLRSMAMRVRQFVGLLEDIVLRDALSRVATYLLKAKAESADTIHLPSLKKHLASHLNLTSETFSRTLRRLIDAGLIAELDNARVRLLNRPGLDQVAEGLFPQV